MSDTYLVARADIILDPQCQVRAGGLVEAHVLALQDAISDGQRLPPLKTVRTPDGKDYLYDGFHRIEAGDRESVMEWEVQREDGDLAYARFLACTVNLDHGLALSREAKRRQIMLAIERGVGVSDREIAKRCGVSHPTIGRYRQQMQEQAQAEAEPTSAPNEDSGTMYQSPAGGDAGDRDDAPAKKAAKQEAPEWSGGGDVPEKFRKLPAHCIPEWDRASRLQLEATGILIDATTAMLAMQGGAFEQALVSEAAAKLKDAAKLVKAAQPWAVCPACKGRQQMMEACNCCKGAGFVLRGVWEALPKGARA